MRCDFNGAAASDLRVSLGDGADAASVSGESPSDPGGPLPSDVLIAGGPGADRLDAGTAHGILHGGKGNDVLTAGSLPIEFRGGTGNDRMVGGAGADRFSASPVRDGRDTLIGGGESDIASYEARGRGVRADLEGDRDDGARRERDRIARDVEGLAGGSGSDRLFGDGRGNTLLAGDGRDLLVGRGGDDTFDGVTSRAAGVMATGGDRILAGAGDDSVAAGAGPDLIDGGAGRDRVSGNAGDDRIELRDGGLDEAECGEGHDRITLDQRDHFSHRYGGTCELFFRSRPPVAVFFGHEARTFVEEPAVTVVIGCPGDARAACTGEAEMIVNGRPGGATPLSFEPGEHAEVRLPLDSESWERSRRGE